jgi:hypothetical protein
MIHGLLKGGGGICEAKVHHIWLVEAILHLEGCLPSILLLNSDVVIPLAYVQSYEEFLFLQLFQDLLDPGNGVDISHCPLVNFPIVLDGVQAAILLFNKELGR